MSARVCIQLPHPTTIDPLVVLDAVRPSRRSASLSAGPGIRLRLAGERRPCIDVATRADRVLVSAPGQTTAEDSALLHDIASAISARYRGRVITSPFSPMAPAA